MKLTIQRETLLKPLQMVSGVIERRQTLPVLANVLLRLKSQELTLTGTDLEVELQARVAVENPIQDGSITVPAKKLLDICRTLPDNAEIELISENSKLMVKSGRSRFNLVTIPAQEFPHYEDSPGKVEFSIPRNEICSLVEQTQFAMAQQDVRYYLNGMLLELVSNGFNAVATDGHRLAFGSVSGLNLDSELQVIIPRKGVMELSRLLAEEAEAIDIILSNSHLRLKTQNYTFTTKLIDGQYPDYHKVIPKGGDKIISMDRDLLKQALSRVAVLSSEKHRGVRLELTQSCLKISANNPEQEEAEEELLVDYSGEKLNIGFNVTYLLDVLNALPSGNMQLTFGNSNSSVCIVPENSKNRIYVVMPMRL